MADRGPGKGRKRDKARVEFRNRYYPGVTASSDIGLCIMIGALVILIVMLLLRKGR